VTSPGGCDNSWGTGGARLQSWGRRFVDDCTVVFTTTGEPPSALSLVLQGIWPYPNGRVYGQGVRCVVGSLKRLYVKTAIDGSITAPGPGDPSVIDRSAQLGDVISTGTDVALLLVPRRDPTILGGPCGAGFNTTQTQEIHWDWSGELPSCPPRCAQKSGSSGSRGRPVTQTRAVYAHGRMSGIADLL
jgi:hypothetical protein